MTDDKDIEMLFATAKTEFDDNDRMMASLNAKLDKVEYIRRIQDQKARQYKIALVVAFVAGILFCGVAIVILNFLPAADGLHGLFARPWAALALSLLLSGAAVCLAFNVRDISAAKAMQK